MKNYCIFFIGAFVYWEFILTMVTSGGIYSSNIGLLWFIPAEALLFTALCGIHKKVVLVNKIVSIILCLLIGLYYATQLVYFRIFGSLISVNLLGMGGEVLGNFGWAVKGAIINSLGFIFLIALPAIIMAVFSFVKFKAKDGTEFTVFGSGYSKRIHLVALVLVVALWFGGVQGLKLMGTERGTAYYVLNDPLSDTDTTAGRIGTLATTVVEAGSMYFGLGAEGESVAVAVNQDALTLGEGEEEEAEEQIPDDEPGQSPEEDEAASAAGDNEEEPEEEEEESFVPVERVNEAFDFETLSENATDNTIKSLCDYFNSKRPTKTNEYTGLFEGYNLIYICGEAFSNYGIDKDITPTLYEMANSGIVLTNYYNSFPNTTTNGEYAFATSYWPDISRWADSGKVTGSFAQSASTYMPYGLGDMFASVGVDSYAYHNYYGNYYWRDHSWPNLGYDNIKFMGSGMQFTSTWPASDLELFEQSVDDYIENDRFNAYYMTFSGHGPYTADNRMYLKNIDTVRELAGDKYEDDAILGYFCGEYELELGMRYLLERLEKAGQLEKTVIVLTGDHFPYFLPESAKKELNGGEPLEDEFEQFHSTCIIYNAGMKEPIVNDEYCCNVDILPTMLNLFGIDYDSRILMGNDVFSDGIHRARLYNGSFITKYVKYYKKTDEKVWSDAVSGYTESRLAIYFDAMLDYTEGEYTASLQALKSNFWLYLWKNSELLTAEEVETELARERAGQSDYDAEAARQAEQEALEAQRKAEEAAAEEAARQEAEQEGQQ